MSHLRRLVRMPAMIVMLLLGLAITLLAFPFMSRSNHRATIRRWSGWLLYCCGITVQVHRSDSAPDLSADELDSGYLLLVNHISWLDIFVINQHSAARFIAKSEIAKWPVVGTLVARVGTIFIERSRRRAIHDVLHKAADHLSAQELVSIFPEGTTGDGKTLMPFYGNLIQAAIIAGQPVLPIGLRYEHPDGSISSSVSFVGDTTFLQSAWNIGGATRAVAHLHILEPIFPTDSDTRQSIAEHARQVISSRLELELVDKIPDGLRDHLAARR
jgi:1-acyl-sn-glycerol-3-phosphate acyltransferase